MKYLSQITIIFLISLLGEILRLVLPFPIPASVYGLLILLLLLILKIIKPDHIKEVSNFLIENMSIMFVGPAISIITVWAAFKDRLFPYLIIILVSTFLVMVVSGKVTQVLLKKEAKND